MLKNAILLFLIFTLNIALSQNTIGLLSYDPDKSYDGYNLFFSHNQANVYLIDNCGQIVHSWTDEDGFVPGNMAYLMPNGNLVKCKRRFSSAVNDPIWAGGGGEFVEIRDWDNNLLWSFEQNDSLRRMHHDVAPMSNGNILILSWELKTMEEAIQAGRDPQLLPQEKIWPDYVFEINPDNDSIVWEWHVWDHLVQDFDASKDNFGEVADHPELVDANFDTSNGIADWLHSNSLDYNETLDQIMISVPHFNEIWVIDHSTTTEEAAGHSGGRGGKGGDLLYRWGNPLAYNLGVAEDQDFFFQHDAHWIDDFIAEEDGFFGKIMVFNNRVEADISTVNIINPPFDQAINNYVFGNTSWGPDTSDRVITHPEPSELHSTGLSSAQLLPNGNVLILSGRWGYAFELSPQNEIVWEYRIPFLAGNRVTQGDTLRIGNNITFRLKRYPKYYAAFDDKDLSPQEYLELNPDTAFCALLLPTFEIPESAIKIYPNPANQLITIDGLESGKNHLRIYDQYGRLVRQTNFFGSTQNLDISQWENGVYYIQLDGIWTRKFVVLHH